MATDYEPQTDDPLSANEQQEILFLQQSVLESVVNGAEHAETISRICDLAESIVPNSISSVMLFDESTGTLRLHAAPSLPPEAAIKLDFLKPGAEQGSCGRGIYDDEPQYVCHIPSDARWNGIRKIADDLGLMSCWSVPIRSKNRKTVGTFALSGFESRDPTQFHKTLLAVCSAMIGVTLERKRAYDKLNLLDKAFEGSEDGMLITDVDRKILASNPAFSSSVGYSNEEIRGMEPGFFLSASHSVGLDAEIWRHVASFGFWKGEVWNRRKSGEVFPEWLSVSEIIDRYGKTSNYLCSFSDSSNVKSAENEIRYLSSHDVLTGLPNVSEFRRKFDEAVLHAAENGLKAAVLSIDMDNFKLLNDSFGYSAGDEMLKLLSKKIRDCLGENDLICRHGGDEFIALISGITDESSALSHAEAMLRSIAHPFRFKGMPISMSCSVGAAIFPDDGGDFEKLIAKAEKAMHQAKDEGRNSVRTYSDSGGNGELREIDVVNGLREALSLGRLRLFYQPQIDLRTGLVVGAEALIRWIHPKRGVVSPNSFISIAERTGVIAEIGKWSIYEAAKQAAEWRRSGLTDLTVAINVSAVQFLRDGFEQSLFDALAKNGLDPRFVKIEITESILMHDSERVKKLLSSIKEKGAKLSIDDFGTGYSSLAYLKKFNIDQIKIDQSFMRNVKSDPNDKAIVKAIVQMAKALKVKTVAEGVEDDGSLELVKRLKCDEVQGYVFSKPLPAEQFVEFVKKRNRS